MLLLSAFSSPFRKNLLRNYRSQKKSKQRALLRRVGGDEGRRKELRDAIAIAVYGKSVSP